MRSTLASLIFVFMAVLIPGVTAQTQTVALVSDNVADHAVAEALAEVAGLKIVTTPWGEYNASLVEAVKALNPSKVFILGGSMAVPEEYELALNFTTTVRIAGRDRVETAGRVLGLFRDDFRGKGIEIARGDDSGGIRRALAKAKARGGILLFIRGDEVSKEVEDAIKGANATEIEVLASPDMNASEVESEAEERLKVNVSVSEGDKRERALEQIEEARKALAEAETESGNVTDGALQRLLNQSRLHLAGAEEAFNASKFGEAYGLANAAEHLAENAERIAKRLREAGKEDKVERKITRDIQKLEEKLVELERKAGERGANISVEAARAKAALQEASAALDQNDTVTAVIKLEEARGLIADAKVSLEGEKKEKEGRKEEREESGRYRPPTNPWAGWKGLGEGKERD